MLKKSALGVVAMRRTVEACARFAIPCVVAIVVLMVSSGVGVADDLDVKTCLFKDLPEKSDPNLGLETYGGTAEGSSVISILRSVDKRTWDSQIIGLVWRGLEGGQETRVLRAPVTGMYYITGKDTIGAILDDSEVILEWNTQENVYRTIPWPRGALAYYGMQLSNMEHHWGNPLPNSYLLIKDSKRPDGVYIPGSRITEYVRRGNGDFASLLHWVRFLRGKPQAPTMFTNGVGSSLQLSSMLTMERLSNNTVLSRTLGDIVKECGIAELSNVDEAFDVEFIYRAPRTSDFILYRIGIGQGNLFVAVSTIDGKVGKRAFLPPSDDPTVGVYTDVAVSDDMSVITFFSNKTSAFTIVQMGDENNKQSVSSVKRDYSNKAFLHTFPLRIEGDTVLCADLGGVFWHSLKESRVVRRLPLE